MSRPVPGEGPYTVVAGRLRQFVCAGCRQTFETYSANQLFCAKSECQQARRERLNRKKQAWHAKEKRLKGAGKEIL